MKKAGISIYVLIFIGFSLFLIYGFLIWIQAFILSSQREILKKKAFYIAESGIEYYRWHLNHEPKDYQDGTNQPGPYIHNFYDRRGNLIGHFILDITPPALGSTIVSIQSKGVLKDSPSIEKILKVKLGIPSFAKYSVVLNDNTRFGANTEVYGEIHSNGGIRFDGIAYNLVSSALETYQDPDHSPPQEWAVHTHVNPRDPYPPEPLPIRQDIFKTGRKIGVPRVDFIGITRNLAVLKEYAQQSGIYLGPSRAEGYEIILKTNGTFDLYKVTQLLAPPSRCTILPSDGQNKTWSISRKNFIRSYNFPSNGIIFVEDNVWVSGQINNARLLIASARFPDIESQRTNIIINNSLKYSHYDGTDVIGLIAQNNINIGLKSEDNLRIDSALVAQNGRVGRYYYSSSCGTEYKRNSITVYGMIGSNKRYGFSWVCKDIYCSGYQNRTLIYNANILYNPPPEFPLTNNFYEILEWEEIK